MRTLAAVLVVLLSCLSCSTPASAKQWKPPKDAGPRMPHNKFAQDREWWQHAVFYEIYPRSFADADNDGTGDLKGITEHLDYLAALGIDAIWITPCFPSPQIDFGYDVSDYRNIDRRYGTLADMDRLIAEGKKRGIRVILDFVVNHTSDQHAWFKASRQSIRNPYRDYYVWKAGKASGKPPTNYTSIFGGSSWKLEPRTKQYYYHFFYPEQPDLNWRNPTVEKEMFDIARWWFKRGIYGFRLDAVDTLFEDPEWRDNPSDKGKDAYGQPKQKHVRDSNLPEVHTELQKLRKVADEFPGRVLVGETWTETPAQLAVYYGPKSNELQMPMYFNFTMVNALDPAAFRSRIDAIEKNAAKGWPVYVLSNHDIRRQVERYSEGKKDQKGKLISSPIADKDAVAKVLAALYLTLRGTAIMYYGEELGMQNNDPKRREDVKDVIGRLGWPEQKGRDGERTPMQWQPTANAGFNTGAATWLPVHPDYKTRNAATQMADKSSVLNWYRRIIQLRRSHPVLTDGAYVALDANNREVLSYARQSDRGTIIVSINMTGKAKTVSLRIPEKPKATAAKVLASTAVGVTTVQPDKLSLGPLGVIIAEVR